MEQTAVLGVCLNPYEHHPAPDLSPGRIQCAVPTCGFLVAGGLINHWRVSRLLGRGPISDLYLAFEADMPATSEPKMLVKVLRALPIGPLAELERRLEQLLALRHAHIHPLQGVGWTNQSGMLYFLSTYEEQGSLSRRDGARSRLPALAIAATARQVAEALQYAHDHEVMHGRVKLDNCLLVGPATVQVSDFYSCILNRDARYASSSLVAPEQLYGQSEAASDQYALAVVTYQLLVGELPFADSGSQAALVTQDPRLPRSVSEFRPDVSGRVDQILSRALSRHPNERYPTISAFALALQAALETSDTGPVSSVGRVISQFPPLSEPGMPPPAPAPARPPLTAAGHLTPLCHLPGHTSAATLLRWARDGFHLASAGDDREIRLWRIERRIGTPLTVLAGHTGEVLALGWSPDSKVLASGAADGSVRTWSLAAAMAKTAWWGHDGSVLALDWSPDGRYIASGGADRTIRLWDRQGTAASVWQAHGRGGITALAWSPDGRVLASGGADRTIQIWGMPSGSPLATINAHDDEIRYLAWSSQGSVLASYGRKKDTRVCLWNRQTGRLLATLGGHTQELVGAFWSSDGTWLATASADSTLRFWDTHQHLGEPIGWPIHLQSPLVSMMGAPKSGLIALGLADLLIQVLQFQA